ncbi:hypothetical protein BTA51_28565 [Hahella sp. CCB-MM4]|nr:hypothetical protein BTA51_28565 [Hahella sp. CCB-MM4]
MHHAEGGAAPQGIAIEKIPGTGKLGFYKAKVFRLGAGGGKRAKRGGSPPGSSSMFPDEWSRSQVRMIVNQAYYKAVAGNRSLIGLDEILGPKYKGISIKLEFDGAKVTSVYPVF